MPKIENTIKIKSENYYLLVGVFQVVNVSERDCEEMNRSGGVASAALCEKRFHDAVIPSVAVHDGLQT